MKNKLTYLEFAYKLTKTLFNIYIGLIGLFFVFIFATTILATSKPTDGLSVGIIFAAALIGTIAFFMILIPPILILKYVMRLLQKANLNTEFFLSEQTEIKKIKILLFLQLIFNILVAFNTPATTFSSMMDNSILEKIPIEFIPYFDLSAHIMEITSWVTVPFDKSMPILYYITLITVLKLANENQNLKNELNEIV